MHTPRIDLEHACTTQTQHEVVYVVWFIITKMVSTTGDGACGAKKDKR